MEITLVWGMVGLLVFSFLGCFGVWGYFTYQLWFGELRDSKDWIRES